MSTCRACGGVIGRDCFNPQECEWITESMQRESEQQGMRDIAAAVVAEAVEELNCHQRQDILDRKTRQYEKTCELAERLLVAMFGSPLWQPGAMASDAARAAWIQAEAMIDFANWQRPVEEAEANR
jgi:hypothetical protein